ncbi:MAG TPA: CBS domain-containing protein [Gemmatimonadales bacterium]|nr:CBS domain-containing protein [Gemmatimonadales bacterium]
MIAGTLCRRKIATVSPGESLRIAARRMEDHEVGTLVVVEPHRADRAVGMLTDRDLTMRCIARALDPDATSVSQVMSSPVHTIDENAPLGFALNEMAAAATRRLVVTGANEKAVGILSLDDLLGLLCEQAAALSMLLQKQRPLIGV